MHDQTQNENQLELLKQFARRLCERGLAAPAIFALELHKPLLTLFHSAALGYSPILRLLCGTMPTERLLALLSSRENLEQCIRLIEQESNTLGTGT